MAVKELAETIKSLGPIGLAAVIVALTVAIPVALKIDERYAKEKDLQEKLADTNKKLEDQINHLTTINGQMQLLITVMLPKQQVVLAEPPRLPELSVEQQRALASAPKITPEEQRRIDESRPKEVSLTLIKNNTIKTDEKLKQALKPKE